MSGVYRIVCHACTYSQGLKFGVGTKYPYLERAVCLIQPEIQSQIQQILGNNGLSKTDFGYRFLHCGACNNLCDAFWVRIENGGGEAYETEFECNKCGQKLSPIPEPELVRACPCPDCYNVDLDLIKVMAWD